MEDEIASMSNEQINATMWGKALIPYQTFFLKIKRANKYYLIGTSIYNCDKFEE